MYIQKFQNIKGSNSDLPKSSYIWQPVLIKMGSQKFDFQFELLLSFWGHFLWRDQKMSNFSYPYQSLKPLKEKGQDQYEPDQEQIQEYAKYIGVNLPGEEYLLELARQGVKALLPKDWEACQAADGELVYRNTVTKVVQQQHPLDELYRQKVVELRQAYTNFNGQQLEDQLSNLNTIIQEKSQDRSLSDSDVNTKAILPSKQIFKPTFVLKQEESSQLNKAVIYGSSKDIDETPKQSKLLPQLSSLIQNNKSSQLQFSDNKYVKSKQKSKKQTNRKQIERLKAQLQNLKKHEKAVQELLSELQRGNEQKTQLLKLKLIGKFNNKI